MKGGPELHTKTGVVVLGKLLLLNLGMRKAVHPDGLANGQLVVGKNKAFQRDRGGYANDANSNVEDRMAHEGLWLNRIQLRWVDPVEHDPKRHVVFEVLLDDVLGRDEDAPLAYEEGRAHGPLVEEETLRGVFPRTDGVRRDVLRASVVGLGELGVGHHSYSLGRNHCRRPGRRLSRSSGAKGQECADDRAVWGR